MNDPALVKQATFGRGTRLPRPKDGCFTHAGDFIPPEPEKGMAPEPRTAPAKALPGRVKNLL